MKFRSILALSLLSFVAGCADTADPDPQACEGTGKSCTEDRNSVIACINNRWTTVQECQTGTICDYVSLTCKPTSEPSKCTEDATMCDPNANQVLICKDGTYVTSKTCATDEKCNQATNDCEKTAQTNKCEGSASKCDNNSLYTCDGGSWKLAKACQDDETCNETSGECDKAQQTECEGSASKCENNSLYTCDGGSWKLSKACQTDETCDETTGDCVKTDQPNECEGSASKCDGSSLYSCENGRWNLTKVCTPGTQFCDEKDGTAQCLEFVCEDGTTCENNTLKICQNHQFTTSKECLASEICNDKKGTCDPRPECEADQFKCEGEVLYDCSADFKWHKKQTCVEDETKHEKCDETAKKCIDTSECQKDEYYCDQNMLMTCGTNGKWKLDDTCEVTEKCNAKTKRCELIPVCDDDQYECSGLTLMKCVDGQWTDHAKCQPSQTCDSDLKKCRDCNPGTYVCENMSLKFCNNGNWENKSTCEASQICSTDKGTCLDCEGDGYKCDGSKVMQCKNNQWVKSVECDTNAREYCDPSQGKCLRDDECEKDQFSCKGQKLMNCKDGLWVLKEDCAETHECNADLNICKLKPVCKPKETKCENNILKECNEDGQWVDTNCDDTNAICVTSEDNSQCVEKWTLPEWCSIHALDDIEDRGYGRVKMPADVGVNEIRARLVCGSVNDPVLSWTHEAESVYNTQCSTCGEKIEFMSYSMKAPAGNYQCTYRFDFGPESIACLSNTSESRNGGKPILLKPTTRMTASQTFEMTVPAKPNTQPTWCYFKHVDDNFKVAYGRILLPNNTTPAMISAKLICGDNTKPASNWTIYRPAKQNLSCDKCNNNVEFMSESLKGVEKGKYSCAFQFDVAGKSYVCPTYRNSDQTQTGGIPIELTSGKMLNATDKINVEGEPVTLWDITID